MAAVIVGAWIARAIVNAVAVNQSGGFANWIDVPLDFRVMGFTIAVGVATAIVFGVGPALWATRVDPLDAMRQRARGTIGGGSRFGIAQALVAFQVALAFVLILGGSLLVRSFISMTSQDLGFDRAQRRRRRSRLQPQHGRAPRARAGHRSHSRAAAGVSRRAGRGIRRVLAVWIRHGPRSRSRSAAASPPTSASA